MISWTLILSFKAAVLANAVAAPETEVVHHERFGTVALRRDGGAGSVGVLLAGANTKADMVRTGEWIRLPRMREIKVEQVNCYPGDDFVRRVRRGNVDIAPGTIVGIIAGHVGDEVLVTQVVGDVLERLA